MALEMRMGGKKSGSGKQAKGWAALICLGLSHCSEPQPNKEKLELQATDPITISAGDTTPVLVASRTTFSQTGRTVNENPYVGFRLVVADTALAQVVGRQQLVGKTAGETTVRATDDASNLVSDRRTLKVVAKP